MKQADAAEKLAALGFDPVLSSPDEFAARIRTDIPKWAEVIRAAHIRPE
jgi:tripartite-type tricarboxylate transporter receptor subunit TctC